MVAKNYPSADVGSNLKTSEKDVCTNCIRLVTHLESQPGRRAYQPNVSHNVWFVPSGFAFRYKLNMNI